MNDTQRATLRDPRRGGRPRKFAEPSQPVTVTLPKRVLELLSSVDSDRARAISKVTEAACADAGLPGREMRLVEVESGSALMVVGPCAKLRE
ncbi:MAG: hypothetical protein PHR35_14440, partial [Kiritimatiellae bacterium]|nr:hypothetical protein [Kiritimatiellia bacterium]